MGAEQSNVMFERVALIGIGLIGSSLARVIRRDGLARHISIAARTQATLDTAKRLGLGDSFSLDAAEAVKGADLVVLCTPLGAYKAIAQAIAPALRAGTILTDVGSVKETMRRDVAPFVPTGVHVVPGHPVAGTEHSGPESGFPELFKGRWCILTPEPNTDKKAIERVTAAGMKVVPTGIERSGIALPGFTSTFSPEMIRSPIFRRCGAMT